MTHLLLIAYTTKHSILSLCLFHRGKQSGLVRVFLVQLGFHQTPILKCPSWHQLIIIKRNPIQGGSKVLALVEGGRIVSFVEAQCVLHTNGVSTYAV
jgi:hypothetical protein